MAFVSNLGIAFREVVARFPERIALFYPETNQKVNYADLGRMVDQMTNILWTFGLRHGQVAAFFHDKNLKAFATMLACLRLGVVYTNMDPDSPWERIRKIFENCSPNVIINAFEKLPFEDELSQAKKIPVLHLYSINCMNSEEVLPPEELVQGGSPAYIMFTSGSTGMPKGAVMSHANLLWFIQWSRERFGITPNDVLTNVNPIYFDNSVFDFYTAIFSGATLVPLTTAQVKNAQRLVSLVEKGQCTVWFSVPSLLIYLLTIRAIKKNNFINIRKFIFGGEGFPKPKLKMLFDLYGNRAELENVYGPTECTCICSAKTITSNDFDDMQNLASLGPLAQNFGFEILSLDEDKPNIGELFIRGPQVGLGYYRDPERTAKAFFQNPNHNKYIDIGYRTGDLVELDDNGWLFFKGRVDFQIKHMGYRIELEEIESALASLQGIEECAVVYLSLGNGLGQIIAFVAMIDYRPTELLLLELSKLVPRYMIPQKIMIQKHLPKNANGKIDRIALQASL